MTVAQARFEREIEELSQEILERYEEVNVLYRLSDSFRDMFDEREILDQLLFEAARAVRAESGWVAVLDAEGKLGGAEHLERVVTPHCQEMRADAALPRSGALSTGGGTGAAVAGRSGIGVRESVVGAELGPRPRPSGGACALAMRSIAENRILTVERGSELDDRGVPVVAVPLPGKTAPLGALVLEKPATEEAFRSGDVRLVAAVAAYGASVIENRRLALAMKQAERVNGEIEIARRIQQGLLPASDPDVNGLEVSGMCRPAQDIGGDYFGYSHVGPGRFGITIADVSGHSIGAAIGMVMARCLIQSEAHQSTSPARIASRVNTLLNRDLTDPGMFVTAFLCVYEEETARLYYTNAGHNPPLLYRAADGSIQDLSRGSLALGIDPGAEYFDCMESLHPGDMLVLYTDGLTEARRPGDEMFGLDRLKQAILECCEGSARAAVESINHSVVQWRGGPDFADDITLVVARKD